MKSEIEKLQHKLEEERIPSSIEYVNIVSNRISDIISKMKESDFELHDRVEYPVDLYIEICTQYMVKEYLDNINNYSYTLHRDTKLPIHCVLYVLEEHPYLINLIHRNITYDEWESYRKTLLDEMQYLYGKRTIRKPIEILCGIEKNEIYDPNRSNIHNFRYFMGLDFMEENVSIKYNDIVSKIGDKTGLLAIHVSKRVPKDSVVMYKQIEKINKNLILNEDKVKRLNSISYPKSIYEYDKDYDIINPNGKSFYVCICYDDARKLKDCTFSLSTEGYPMSFLDRYVNGACPKTLEANDIKIYLQEWISEKFEDVRPSIDELRHIKSTLQAVAQENYDANLNTCINKIIADKRMDEIMENEIERGIFNTYVHGMRILSKTRMGDVVDYIVSYLGEGAENI